MSVEGEFAERVRKRREDGFAGRGSRRLGRGEKFAERVRRRSGREIAAAEWWKERGGSAFAERVMARGVSFGTGGFPGTILIFLKQQSSSSSDQHFYQLLLRLNQTWQSRIVSKQERAVYRDALALSIVKRLEHFLKPKEAWRGQLSVGKELTVFRDIATIFVNRGSRPDLAKKAERDLVKVLSKAYYENNPERQAKEDPIFKRQITHEELVMTKRTVADLEEQVKKQSTLLFQLQKNVETAIQVPEPDMGKITGEVMKRMEREMHLERLRRG
ncbi:MAG: hypothetical protein K2N41_04330 [Lachnospiraceae bacterium]|nr:hypothetical protein [Lachnospiraceae bacterium]